MSLSEYTILCVEDNIETQELLKLFLEEDVKKLYQAFNGEEGYALFKAKRPDVILTDINMPLLNGLDMAKRIKAEDKEQAIIFISAFDDRETLLEAISIGIDGFIPKPLDMKLLYSNLEKILEEKKETIKLRTLAYYDSLTSLLNRFSFDTLLKESLSSALKEHKKLALLFIDLDDFKHINDTYTHSTGDEVLKIVAKRIQRSLCDNDICARISGDEFAVLLQDINNLSDIENIAKRIIEVISTPIVIGEKSLSVGCSIGISLFPKDTRDYKDFIDLSDIAMYQAKKSGKNTYTFYHDIKKNHQK